MNCPGLLTGSRIGQSRSVWYHRTTDQLYQPHWQKTFPCLDYDAAIDKMWCNVCQEFQNTFKGTTNKFMEGLDCFKIDVVRDHDLFVVVVCHNKTRLSCKVDCVGLISRRFQLIRSICCGYRPKLNKIIQQAGWCQPYLQQLPTRQEHWSWIFFYFSSKNYFSPVTVW